MSPRTRWILVVGCLVIGLLEAPTAFSAIASQSGGPYRTTDPAAEALRGRIVPNDADRDEAGWSINDGPRVASRRARGDRDT